jgi:hypothetical protein
MSSTDRQNRLLATEDWTRIYQSFRNAEFKSYDFDTLRRAMINYLRENYPEEFNDYIESSEYLALIDMIAFLGQNLAFRIDLNARENFLELAERRESILRLARLLSYNPKRNQCANGLLKIQSISTTEDVIDSNGVNLQNQSILWNDPANPNWQEHFNRVLNAALPDNTKTGNPLRRENINGIPSEQYKFRATNTTVPSYGFSKSIDGRSTSFSAVSTEIVDGKLQEESPVPGNSLSFIFRNDGQGPQSSNYGYFLHFRQGNLQSKEFDIENPSTSEVVTIEETNINDSDIWLYSLNENGAQAELWSKIDSVEGNNVIYNSLSNNVRNIYSVLTRAEDRISLVFSDGTFGNLPNGSFRVFYRTSANRRLIIVPDDMRNISITIPYESDNNKAETLTLNLGLEYTVDNASESESNDSIKTNAPATYYTQNRLITGEDYQLGPLGISQEIVKTKSVNRTSSGISRYFDLVDATGKYSSTNLFGSDGSLYKEYQIVKESFSFSSLTDIEIAILNTIQPILQKVELLNFYLDSFPRVFVQDLQNTWQKVNYGTNQSTGFFVNTNNIRAQLGDFTLGNMKFVKSNSLLKFSAPAGKHFLNGELVDGPPDFRGGTEFIWTKVISVYEDGTELFNGNGPVLVDNVIPTGALLSEVITALPNQLSQQLQQQLVDQIFSYKNFGLRFARGESDWRLINEDNISTSNSFSIGKTGDTTGENLDSSWLLLFETDGINYTVSYRSLRYIFESDREIRFFYDGSDPIFDIKSGEVIKDKISILDINPKPDNDRAFGRNIDWEIVKEYRNRDGYVDSKKVEIGFYDSDNDGIIDNPDVFSEIVNDEDINAQNFFRKLVFMEKTTSIDGLTDFVYVSPESIDLKTFFKKGDEGALSQYNDGDLFYFFNEDIFQNLNLTTASFVLNTNYRAEIGRDNLKFQYYHAADENKRIDPSASNIIDTYLLTRGYDTEFRNWLENKRPTKPLPPSSDELFLSYGTALANIKSISDEVVYHPVKYKILFGNKAEPSLQAQFKIVKNPELVVNDNDIKAGIISAINRFFAIDNWDFGDIFYFSELANYVMSEMSPDIVSFVIVPTQADQTFGSLFEIKSESDEIFISGATVANIEIIDEITAARLNAEGNVVTGASIENAGIQSTSFTNYIERDNS